MIIIDLIIIIIIRFNNNNNSKIFSVLISLYLFHSFNWKIKLSANLGMVSHVEIVKCFKPEFFFWTTWLYCIAFIEFNLVSVLLRYTATYNAHSFLILCPIFHVFFYIHCKWLTFETGEKVLLAMIIPWLFNHYSITTYDLSIGGILLGNINKSEESIFLLDESIFIFLYKNVLFFSGEKLNSYVASYWFPYFLFIA